MTNHLRVQENGANLSSDKNGAAHVTDFNSSRSIHPSLMESEMDMRDSIHYDLRVISGRTTMCLVSIDPDCPRQQVSDLIRQLYAHITMLPRELERDLQRSDY